MFGKKKPLTETNYCAKYFTLKQSNSVEKDITTISPDFYEYVKVNETTYVCDCLYPDRKKECYKELE